MSKLEVHYKAIREQLEIAKSFLKGTKEDGHEFEPHELEGHINEAMTTLDAMLYRLDEEAEEG